MLAPAKAGPADPACSARPPRRTSPTKSPPTAPVSRPSVPRDGPCRREQRTRSQAETDPGHQPQRPFPIDSSQPPAASSLGGFPTRAEVTPTRSRTLRPASENLHQSRHTTSSGATSASRPLIRHSALRLVAPKAAIRLKDCGALRSIEFWTAIRRRHPTLLLLQDRDDLLLAEPRSLHRPSPSNGRTLPNSGGITGAQVRRLSHMHCLLVIFTDARGWPRSTP